MRHQSKLFVLVLSFFITGQIYAQPDADGVIKFKEKDNVINDDLIVTGSACIGFDCVNGESFGFKTLRLKENNLRIHFWDTSTSASFPTADWCIVANDSSNGGAEYLSFVEEDAGKEPFRITAGAPTNSLWVDSQGDVGIGVASAVVELHIKDGDTPTMRLEQDGSSGFTPQTWDVAGNETNFFIRDVTNGSRLPFKIRQSAPTGSVVLEDDVLNLNQDGANLDVKIEGDTEQNLFYIDASSDEIGIGTNTPRNRFEIDGTDNPTATMGINISGSVSNSGMTLRRDGVTAGGVFSNSLNDLVFFSGGNVERGSFEANGDFVVDGNVVAMSDRRLKNDATSYERGLKEVLQLNPIEYTYNGKGGVAYKDSKIGLIAQELREIVPEMTTDIERGTYDEKGDFKSEGNFIGVNENEIKYLLINAVKDQQKMIDDQELRMETLEKENAELRDMILSLQEAFEGLNIENTKLDGTEGAFLKQNVPNPFDGQTQISYAIPEFSSSASMKIFNVNGALIRNVVISNAGQGIINIEADDLPQGTYTYSLFVDGQIIATEQMVLAK